MPFRQRARRGGLFGLVGLLYHPSRLSDAEASGPHQSRTRKQSAALSSTGQEVALLMATFLPAIILTIVWIDNHANYGKKEGSRNLLRVLV